MGFADTMKGIGRALGGLLETGIQTFGPPIAQAAGQAIYSKIAGQPAGSMGYYQPAPSYQYPTAIPSAPRVPSSWVPLQQAPVQTAPLQRSTMGGIVPATYTTVSAPTVAGALGALGGYLLGGNGNGGSMMPAIQTSPGTSGMGLGSEIMERLRGVTGGLPTMYTVGQASARPVREIQAVNPVTGKIGVWRYMGRPILYSGDLAACKRVRRVAARARRARGPR